MTTTTRNVAQEPTTAKTVGRTPPAAVWDAVAVLDKTMFAKTGWFAIGPDNKRLAGVIIPNLDAGLRLLHEPDAQLAVVGRLRPGLAVVDIDVPGDRGWLIAEQVTRWATQRDLWTLSRPSGGADGRSHVFVAVGRRLDDLTDLVAGIRRHHGYGKNLVDVRDTVRPLSSPHRATGRRTLPLALTGVAAVRLQIGLLESALRIAPTKLRRRRPGRNRPQVTALVPRPRPKTQLPPQWSTWFLTGERPVLRGDDQSRSVYELAATTALVRAGHTVDTAWDLIMKAHPDAMDRARSDQRWWVGRIWNVVVPATEQEVGPKVDNALAAGLETAWELLDERLWQLPVGIRPFVWAVGAAVLDRIRREGEWQVPCAERCVQTDTGIRDRTTVRNALRMLDGYVGIVHHETFDKTNPLTSFEFEILPDPDREVSIDHPPSSHDPLRTSHELHGLDLRCRRLRTILATAGEEGFDADTLARAAQLTQTPTSQLTESGRRTLRRRLEDLGGAGWAVCDSRGRWHASEPDPAVESTQHARAEAIAAHNELVDKVNAERDDYRRMNRCDYPMRRAAAIERDHSRYKAWWDGLSSAQRAERAEKGAEAFARLSPTDQMRSKHAWAAARATAGVSEADRHAAWLTSMTVDELASRAAARAAWYWDLPPQLRREYVQAWDAHRARHHVPRAHLGLEPARDLFYVGAA